MRGEDILSRIDGVKIWVGVDLTGGNYNGAENIGSTSQEPTLTSSLISEREDPAFSFKVARVT